jgi:rubrerythrin
MDTEAIKKQIRLLKEAIALEEEASARYRQQVWALCDSRINALLEGIARTEDNHLNELNAHLERLNSILNP